MQLENRVAVITGGGQGIGKGMAERFAAEGASIMIGDIDPNVGQATAEERPVQRVLQRPACCRIVAADLFADDRSSDRVRLQPTERLRSGHLHQAGFLEQSC